MTLILASASSHRAVSPLATAVTSCTHGTPSNEANDNPAAMHVIYQALRTRSQDRSAHFNRLRRLSRGASSYPALWSISSRNPYSCSY